MSKEQNARRKSREIQSLWGGFYFEAFRASNMLFYTLSAIESHKPEWKPTHPAGIRFIDYPGLPDLCLSFAISETGPDDLYGRTGAASQIAYIGWIVDILGTWEKKYRPKIEKDPPGSRIQFDALGDLTKIRNDVVHNYSIASRGHTGRCSTLKWFDPEEKIIFEVRHVLDFLHQVGVIGSGIFAPTKDQKYSIDTVHDEKTLLEWKPTPKLASVRVSLRETDPYLDLYVVFDNGFYCTIPYKFVALDGDLKKCRTSLLRGHHVDSDGNLRFDEGAILSSRELYKTALKGFDKRAPHGSARLGCMSGPWIMVDKKKKKKKKSPKLL